MASISPNLPDSRGPKPGFSPRLRHLDLQGYSCPLKATSRTHPLPHWWKRILSHSRSWEPQTPPPGRPYRADWAPAPCCKVRWQRQRNRKLVAPATGWTRSVMLGRIALGSHSGRGAAWSRACLGRKRSAVRIRAPRPAFHSFSKACLSLCNKPSSFALGFLPFSIGPILLFEFVFPQQASDFVIIIA